MPEIRNTIAVVLWFAGAALGQQARPAISISNPSDGAAFLPNSTVALSATVSTAQSPVVEFFANGLSVGVSAQPSTFGSQTYTVNWSNVPAGMCALTAQATDSGGQTWVSSPVTVYVGVTGPQAVTVEGFFQAAVEDRFSQGTSVTHYALKTPAGHYALVFPDTRMAKGILSGSRVRVRGQISGSSFTVNKVPATSGPALIPRAVDGFRADITMLRSPAAVATTGVRKIAIVFVNYTDDQSQPMTLAVASQGVSLLNQYFQEVSYGKLSASGDVFGYLQLPLSIQENCAADGLSTISNAGMQAAQNSGIDLSSYQSIVFEGPTTNNCLLNEGTVGGNPGVVVGGLPVQLTDPSAELHELAHEVGHNLGMYLALAINCGAVIYNPNLSCQTQSGNILDVMGTGTGHYNAAFKDLLGWLSPQIISATGVYNLAPLEKLSASYPLALKIAPLLGNDTFYIEYRQPIGFDSGFPYPQAYTGALFNLDGNPTELLNMNPNSGVLSIGATQAALAVGSQYVDYANRFSVTTLSANPASLELRILVPPLTSPTLLIVSPANGASLSGSTQVVVDALDRTGVTKVELYVDGALIGNQVLAPYQFALDTTQQTSGAHNLTATAYNASGATFSQTISVQISNPAVAITSPVDQTVIPAGGSVDLNASATHDPSSTVSKVEFFQNGVLLGAGVLSGGTYTYHWSGVAAETYAVTAKVTGSDATTATSAAVHVIAKLPPQLTSGGTINAASSIPGQAVTPGSLVAIYGSSLAASLTSASAVPLPMALAGVSVTFDGIQAPLTFVSDGQINAQVPWNAAAGTATLVVNSFGVNTATQNVQIAPFSPGIFTLNYGTGQSIAINLDSTLAAPVGSVAGLTTHPATAGDTIIILATGLGAVTPSIASGSDSSDTLRRTNTMPVVLVGGIPALVQFSGLSPSFVGVNQLNVTIPTSVAASDAVPLQIRVGGITTSAQATLAIR